MSEDLGLKSNASDLPTEPFRTDKALDGVMDVDIDYDPFDASSFDEVAYLAINTDVLDGIARGDFTSGYQHYIKYGFREGRPTGRKPHEPPNRIFRFVSTEAAPVLSMAFSCEGLIASVSGGLMIVGWIDDATVPLSCIRIRRPSWQLVLNYQSIVRNRRHDVEQAQGKSGNHLYGFLGFVAVDGPINDTGSCVVELWLENDQVINTEIVIKIVNEVDLRDVLLETVNGLDFFGNPHIERISCMEGGLGRQIVIFNRGITDGIIKSPYIETFGSKKKRYKGSIIVAIYGKSEFLSLQNALFSGLSGIEDYEFIYVSNSPELGEALLRDARLGRRVHDISQSVMILSGNAGFGAANNIALLAARSDRVINVNPDVFPKDRNWASHHTAILENAPARSSKFFGVPLYYDDGSLMHGGMYFEVDRHIARNGDKFKSLDVVRVEHYGKGAIPQASEFLRPRPVPAVTGAFISTERSWFEKLGGFTEDFVFGHYEDADLCLKSLHAGTPAWIQDIKMWHLEGKGSTRKAQHEGGALVNRWLFTRRWADALANGLIGPQPSLPLLQSDDSLEDGSYLRDSQP